MSQSGIFVSSQGFLIDLLADKEDIFALKSHTVCLLSLTADKHLQKCNALSHYSLSDELIRFTVL